MTEMKDPVRLQIGGSPEAQDLLRSAVADVPTRAQLDHLAARLAPVVTAAPVTTTASLAPWIVAGVAIVGSAAVILTMRDREAAPSPSPTLPAYVAPAPIVTLAETPKSAARTPGRRACCRTASTPDAKAACPRERVTGEASDGNAGRKPVPARPKEIESLDAAHRALSTGDAQRALDLAADHAQLYAKGTMIEEREAIAIEALHRLGRAEQARTRFKDFVVSFPRSGYRARLDHLFEKKP